MTVLLASLWDFNTVCLKILLLGFLIWNYPKTLMEFSIFIYLLPFRSTLPVQIIPQNFFFLLPLEFISLGLQVSHLFCLLMHFQKHSTNICKCFLPTIQKVLLMVFFPTANFGVLPQSTIIASSDNGRKMDCAFGTLPCMAGSFGQ